MARIQLVVSDKREARDRATSLRADGHVVVTGPPDPKKLVAKPPQAMVIDLRHAPASGRDLALWMRTRKATRGVPLVFVGPEGDTRRHVPDAEYAKTWRGVGGALKRALASPVSDPARPASALAGYSGTPLPKKLGIKEGFRVGLVNAPKDFPATLGELPAGVKLVRKASPCDLAIWFVTERGELEARVVDMGKLAPGLWIAWPKQASGMPTDLNGNVVRSTGLANGLVDYKVCAIDATWSGLKFARRKKS